VDVGRVVISRKGKDAGNWYIVSGTSEDGRRVYLVDGRKWSWDRPKKKNPVHIQPTRVVIKEVAEMAETGKWMSDDSIRIILEEIRKGSGGSER